jgi:hypothetical protein
VRTVKTDRRENVGGTNCTIYEVVRDSEKMGEACVAGPEDLRISEADYNALKEANRFMESLAKSAMASSETPAAAMEQFGGGDFEGLPVYMKDPASGLENKLTQVSTQRLAATLFQLPAGYEKIDISQPPPTSQSQPQRPPSGQYERRAPQHTPPAGQYQYQRPPTGQYPPERQYPPRQRY